MKIRACDEASIYIYILMVMRLVYIYIYIYILMVINSKCYSSQWLSKTSNIQNNLQKGEKRNMHHKSLKYGRPNTSLVVQGESCHLRGTQLSIPRESMDTNKYLVNFGVFFILLFKGLPVFGFLIFLVQKCLYTPMFKQRQN